MVIDDNVRLIDCGFFMLICILWLFILSLSLSILFNGNDKTVSYERHYIFIDAIYQEFKRKLLL